MLFRRLTILCLALAACSEPSVDGRGPDEWREACREHARRPLNFQGTCDADVLRLMAALANETTRDDALRLCLDLAGDDDEAVRAGALRFLMGLEFDRSAAEQLRRLMHADPSPRVRAHAAINFARSREKWTASDERAFVSAFRDGMNAGGPARRIGLAFGLMLNVPRDRTPSAIDALTDFVIQHEELNSMILGLRPDPARPSQVAFCRRVLAESPHAKTRLRAALELRRADLIEDDVVWEVVRRHGGDDPRLATKALCVTSSPPPADVLSPVIRAWIEQSKGERLTILDWLVSGEDDPQLTAGILRALDRELPPDDDRRAEVRWRIEALR